MLDNAKLLLSKENVEHLGSLLANLDTTSSVIADHKETIGQGIRDLALASRELQQTLALASRLLGQLDGQMSDKGERLLANADSTMTSLEHLSRNLDLLLSDNRQALGSGLRSMAELGPTIRELRTTLASYNFV